MGSPLVDNQMIMGVSRLVEIFDRQVTTNTMVRGPLSGMSTSIRRVYLLTSLAIVNITSCEDREFRRFPITFWASKNHCTGTGNWSFGEKTVKKNQLRHKIHTTESDFESFMEDNGRGQWGR